MRAAPAQAASWARHAMSAPRAAFAAWALVCALALGGCASAPTHPALRAQAHSPTGLPPLAPVRAFVADWDASGGHQISPDGRRLLWQARRGLGVGLFVRDLDSGGERSWSVPGLAQWAADSRHILLHQDRRGDENTHVIELDSTQPSLHLRDLTPFPGAKSFVHATIPGSGDLLIESNRRDAKVFDLYRWHQATGELRLVARNPGDVAQWVTDTGGRLVGRGTRRDDHWAYEQRAEPQRGASADAAPGTADAAASSQGWREVFRVGLFDRVQALRVPAGQGVAWALSNRGRDKLALVRLHLDSGREDVVAEDARVDVSQVLFSRRTHAPLAVSFEPDAQVWRALDPSFEPVLRRWQPAGSVDRLRFLGGSDDDDRWVLQLTRPDGGQTLLLRRSSAEVTALGDATRTRLHAQSPLGQTQPLSVRARDGLPLQAYLTLPAGVPPRALPTVLLVHGGPWARDVLQGGDPLLAFLANRGYAVLQVNYRGSTGYGRGFTEAGRGEFAGRMHTDLLDALDEVVRQGVADPQRVAIAGASYGGYAALVGMSFTPQRFACGISVVGMSDLVSLLENTPPYWELGRYMWVHHVGDPSDPQDRQRMQAQSPLFRAGQVRAPVLLMHGRHDPRVRLDQSTRMAEALRQAGKSVELHVFDSAGHGFPRWQDRLQQYRITERFLAGCLGGRDGGFDAFELAARVL